MLTYVLVGLGLSMDAFAVSVSSGICIPQLKFRYALRASLAFGFFQFAMPIIGWFLGGAFSTYIQNFDHWIAFGLLAFVGIKMIKESFAIKDQAACTEEELAKKSILTISTLLILALATSIDALAVGLSYRMLDLPILLPSLIIGIVTFGLCLIGTEFGKKIGTRFERWAELLGGSVLIGIGIKILLEHLLD